MARNLTEEELSKVTGGADGAVGARVAWRSGKSCFGVEPSAESAYPAQPVSADGQEAGTSPGTDCEIKGGFFKLQVLK